MKVALITNKHCYPMKLTDELKLNSTCTTHCTTDACVNIGLPSATSDDTVGDFIYQSIYHVNP